MADDLELEPVGAEPVLGKPTMRASNQKVRLVGWYLMLTALSFVVLFPIWLTLVRALSPPIQYFNAGSPVTPVSPEWGVFGKAWNQGNIGDAMLRSVVVTIGITGLSGQALKERAQLTLVVASNSVQHVEDATMVAAHLLCLRVAAQIRQEVDAAKVPAARPVLVRAVGS